MGLLRGLGVTWALQDNSQGHFSASGYFWKRCGTITVAWSHSSSDGLESLSRLGPTLVRRITLVAQIQSGGLGSIRHRRVNPMI
jgi:hypothetical protein